MKFFALCLLAAVVGLASALPGVRVADNSRADVSAAVECPVTDGDEPTYLPDPVDGSVFYLCSNGVPFMMKCESGVFDSETGTCLRIGTYSPVGECPEENGRYPVFLPDSERKDVYYECVWGRPVRMQCPSGLIFKPGKFDNVCVRPDE